MIQIQTIRENPEEIITKLKVKNFDASHLIYSIIELDKEIRSTKNYLTKIWHNKIKMLRKSVFYLKIKSC